MVRTLYQMTGCMCLAYFLSIAQLHFAQNDDVMMMVVAVTVTIAATFFRRAGRTPVVTEILMCIIYFLVLASLT